MRSLVEPNVNSRNRIGSGGGSVTIRLPSGAERRMIWPERSAVAKKRLSREKAAPMPPLWFGSAGQRLLGIQEAVSHNTISSRVRVASHRPSALESLVTV